MPTKTRQRRKGKPLLRKRCMTTSPNNQSSLIDELESRQNDVLDRLAELNGRVEELLNECLAARDARLKGTDQEQPAANPPKSAADRPADQTARESS